MLLLGCASRDALIWRLLQGPARRPSQGSPPGRLVPLGRLLYLRLREPPYQVIHYCYNSLLSMSLRDSRVLMWRPGESSSRGRTGAGLPRHEDNEDNSLPPGGFGMNAWRRASPMIAIEENASTWADTGIDRTS
ncbi:hypothetical protein GW17_00036966 [Ensete ventricosum]|nr:hypothetical protein GW17_00036966 [Ensete ventricosum]